MGDTHGFLKIKRKASSYRPVCERVLDYKEVTRWIACELPSPHPPREARPRVARPRTTPATTVTVTTVPSEPDALPPAPTVSAEELRAMHTRSARATLAALEAILATGG